MTLNQLKLLDSKTHNALVKLTLQLLTSLSFRREETQKNSNYISPSPFPPRIFRLKHSIRVIWCLFPRWHPNLNFHYTWFLFTWLQITSGLLFPAGGALETSCWPISWGGGEFIEQPINRFLMANKVIWSLRRGIFNNLNHGRGRRATKDE